MRFEFSTDAFEPEGRFEGFRDTVRRMFQLDLSTDAAEPYCGRVDLNVGAPTVFGRVVGSTAEFFRTPELTRKTEEGAWLLMTRTGLMHVRHGGIDCDLEPGEAIIFNSIQPHAGRCVVESDTWIVQVPDAVLRALGASDAGNRTALLKKDSPLAGLILGVFEAFYAHGGSMSPEVSAATSDYLSDLVALALGIHGEGRDAAAARGLKAARLQAVLNDISGNFTDPGLDTPAVAARLGVTTRYVHLLLEETGRTFSEHVLEHRLEHARRLLRDRTHAARRIADIAYACGFTDLSYFNRTYRRRFGETPSDTRA